MNVPIRDLPVIMFFRSVALFQKMFFLSTYPPKVRFEILQDECPLKKLFKHLPTACPPKECFEFLLDVCPSKTELNNLPADCWPKARFELLLDECPLKSKYKICQSASLQKGHLNFFWTVLKSKFQNFASFLLSKSAI